MVEGMVGSRLRCAGKSWIRRMFPSRQVCTICVLI